MIALFFKTRLRLVWIVENTYVGPFLVIKKLGTNRRQRVYHARQSEQNRDVALKFISLPPNVDWASALEKIEIEVKELQKLKHPNLVRLYGAGVHENQIFFATELVSGESLASLLSRRGKITPDLVVEFGKQIAEVLNYLHAHDLIHSKLTPEKILITPDHKVKLADLRINRAKRKRWDASRLRELDIAAYLAPEQFSAGATAKSDLYSLGVLIYEMLTGKLPYDLESIGRMAKFKSSAPPPSLSNEVMGCPIWLDKIVTQMLQPDSRNRPHSAKAIVLAFEEIKKLDCSKKSTAAQVVGSFNALNAGVDKTEARELLNKKKKSSSRDFTFFQTVPFLLTSFILIVSFLTIMAWPEALAKQLERYEAMVHSETPEQWSDARVKLKELKERTQDDAVAAKATTLYNLARRKMLVNRAQAGVVNRLQSENVQAFSRAHGLESERKLFQALAIYSQLIRSIPSDDDENYILEEVRERIEELQKSIAIPDSLAELDPLIDQLSQGSSREEILFSNDVLAKIIIKFAGEPDYQEVVNEAKEVLDLNRAKLEETPLETPPASNSAVPNSPPQ